MSPADPPSARALRAALARSPDAPPWRLERRHAEGGPWFEVDRLWSPRGAKDWALDPPVRLERGDLVRLLGPQGGVVRFWVRTGTWLAPARAVPRELGPHGADWEAAWEGPSDAAAMLEASSLVDRRRLVLAACDCVEPALAVLREEPEVARRALEAARAWVRGEGPVERVQTAASWAAGFSDEAQSGADASVGSAAYHAASAAWVEDPGDAASRAVWQVAAVGLRVPINAPLDFYRKAHEEARRNMARLVRPWIPLSILLLARAGEPTPLSLQL